MHLTTSHYVKSVYRSIIATTLLLHAVIAVPAQVLSQTTAPQVLSNDNKTAVIGGLGTGYFHIDSQGAVSPITVNAGINSSKNELLPGCFSAVWINQQGKSAALALNQNNHYSLPSVSGIDFTALYPSARYSYTDRLIPLKISHNIFCPLLPGDIRNSTLRSAISIFHIENHSANLVDCSIAMSWSAAFKVTNSSASIDSELLHGNNISVLPSSEGLFGLAILTNPTRDFSLPAASNLKHKYELMMMAMPTRANANVTTASWDSTDHVPAWWTEFAASGTVSGNQTPAAGMNYEPAGVIAVKLNIQPKESIDIPFAITWSSKSEPEPSKNSTPVDASQNNLAVGKRILMDYQSLNGLAEEWQKKLLFSNLPPAASKSIINSAQLLSTKPVYRSVSAAIPAAYSSTTGNSSALAEKLRETRMLHRLKLSLFPQLEATDLAAWWQSNKEQQKRTQNLNTTTTRSTEDLYWTADSVDSLTHYTLETGDISLLPTALPALRKELTVYFDTSKSSPIPRLDLPLTQHSAKRWINTLSRANRLFEIGSNPIQLSDDRAHTLNNLLNTADAVNESRLNRIFSDRLSERIRETNSFLIKQFPDMNAITAPSSAMDDPLDWIWMEKLEGFALDRINREITINPELPGSWRSLSIPIFSPTFWGQLQYKPLAGGAIYSIRTDRLIPHTPADPDWNTDTNAGLIFKKITIGAIPSTSTAPPVASPSVHVSLRQSPLGVTANLLADGHIELIFDSPVNMAAGDNLQIEVHI